MKRTNYNKERFYELLAADVKGQVKILRYDCAAHLEDQSDQLFWGRMFKRYAPHKKILFLTHSRSASGNQSTGVGHCLNFRKHLDHNFIICIDSDYRRLLYESGYNINHFIFQTYTYSFENHHCVPLGLNRIIEKSCGERNTLVNWEAIISRYSTSLYEPLLWHLYFLQHKQQIFSKNAFKQLLSIYDPVMRKNINNRIEEELYRLELITNAKVTHLKKEFPEVCSIIEIMKIKYAEIGLTPERTYLFIRGHNIFDSICRVGSAVCWNLLESKKRRLNIKGNEAKRVFERYSNFKKVITYNINYDTYQEIRWIGEDIRNFFQHPKLVKKKE